VQAVKPDDLPRSINLHAYIFPLATVRIKHDEHPRSIRGC
jgi:hypothetical protein